MRGSAGRYQRTELKKLDPRYIVGVTDGEGSFHINIRKWPKNTNGHSVSAEYSIDLVNEDVEILRRLKLTFGCGSVLPKRQKDARLQARFRVCNLKDLNQIIIPFFKKYPLQFPTKRHDFEVWCRVIAILNEGGHLTNDGLKQVIEIRNQFSYRIARLNFPHPFMLINHLSVNRREETGRGLAMRPLPPHQHTGRTLHISPLTTREYLSLSPPCVTPDKALREELFLSPPSLGIASCEPRGATLYAHLGGVQGVNGVQNYDTLDRGAGVRKPALFSPPSFTELN